MPLLNIARSSNHVPVGTTTTLRRLKFALLASIIVPVMLFVAAAWDERSQVLAAAENEAKADVAVLREHVLKTLETDELLIREVDHRIRGMTWEQIRASESVLSAEIGAMHAGMAQVTVVDVTDADGIVQAGTLPRNPDDHLSISFQELWTAQRDADRGTFFSHAYVGHRTGLPSFGISRRRSAPDGRFDGTLHVGVSASYFSNFWSQVISGTEGASVALIRTDGEMLARFPQDLPPFTGPGKRVGVLLSHLAAEPQGGSYRRRSVVDGVDRLYAYARVGSFPLVVRYSMPIRTALAPWRAHLLILGGWGALAAAALVLALLAVIRQVHKLIAEQTRRAEIEKAAYKGQRMELLGQLSAGTAHDLANILQAMQIGATLIGRRAEEPERIRLLAGRLEEDAARGAALTHRMLDLVRRNHGKQSAEQAVSTESINPADVLTDVANMLSRILGSKHYLRCDVAPDAGTILIRGNRTDFEVAVMNLAVNARDAMAEGGEVVITATSEEVGGSTKLGPKRRNDTMQVGPSVPPSSSGRYIRVSVIDSGVGMTQEVLARAGERFFTTKPDGLGTGLGLPGARAFAEQVGGKLTLESEAGRGTIASLWLPAVSSSLTPTRTQVETVC